MTKHRRKMEIERLKQEGQEAFAGGKTVHANPYRDANAQWWRQGWQDAEYASRRDSTPQTPEEMQERIVAWLREQSAHWWGDGVDPYESAADAIAAGEHLP